MASYQHSETFASLKDIKEGLQTNLTTYQYLEVLDTFLEAALDPLATAVPDLVDNYFAVIVAWQTHKPALKFSRDDKHKLPVKLFNSLTTEGRTKRAHQRSMLLNRGILFGLCSVFSRTINTYEKLHDPTLALNRAKRLYLIEKVEKQLNATNLFAATMQFRYFSKKAYRFKELITQKYTRLALLNAKRTYTDLSCEVPLDDIVQTYLIYLNKAIDRCDSRQGVLTTFIQTWFYSARTEVTKVKNNVHTSYEELLEMDLPVKHIDHASDYEVLQHLSHKAKEADPNGVVRYSLSIPEFLTRRQIETLHIFTTPLRKE
jgi:hypothetical protein